MLIRIRTQSAKEEVLRFQDFFFCISVSHARTSADFEISASVECLNFASSSL